VLCEDPQGADLIWTRNVPERTTAGHLKRMVRFLERFPHARVINHPRDLHLSDSKDRAFMAWRERGLPVPVYRLCEEPGDALEFAEQHSDLLIRLNNAAHAATTVVLGRPDRGRIARSFRKVSRKAASLRRRGRLDTRVVAVELLGSPDEHGLNRVFRAFVVGREVIGGYGLVSDRETINLDTSRCGSDIEEAAHLAANSLVDRQLENHNFVSLMVEAVAALHLDVASIDFLWIDDSVVLLEANPLWGPCNTWAGGAAGKARYQRAPEEWHRRARGYCEWADRAAFYERMFDAFGQFRDVREVTA
jgi:glutathione synthase/RimK-type ligase-like ATP-grasp enzyme